uniref:helix-turn-helix domain-containing protein n=1 Tax=Aureimonas psammosilenae TaxID=2495496 RepID=UPI00126071C9
MQEIGRRIGRSSSTMSRELRRNAGTLSGGLEYRVTTARWHVERSDRRPKTAKLALNPALRAYVEDRLAGIVTASSGAFVPGPFTQWKGRRHGKRTISAIGKSMKPGTDRTAPSHRLSERRDDVHRHNAPERFSPNSHSSDGHTG